jgi:hypothetical protein
VTCGLEDRCRSHLQPESLPLPSVLGSIKMLGDFHRLFDFIKEVDFGCVGAAVAEDQLGGFLAERGHDSRRSTTAQVVRRESHGTTWLAIAVDQRYYAVQSNRPATRCEGGCHG